MSHFPFLFFSWYFYRNYKICTIKFFNVSICAITAVVKKCKAIIEKKKKKHDKIVPLAKTKLNSIEVLISRTIIINSLNIQDEFD